MFRLRAKVECRLLPLVILGALTSSIACGQSYSPTLAFPRLSETSASNASPATSDSSAQSAARDSDASESLTLFPHSDASRYWVSAQANIVFQWHPSFPAAYSGPHSFRSTAESATSKVYTLYLGYQLTPATEVFLDAESAGGTGLSSAFGLAGFTNLDVVRNPSLGPTPYLARLMIRQIIPLTDKRVKAERDELHLATSLPARRIEIRAGKFDLADFFDENSWGSDSHLQFLNWTIDNNGAWDYAANTRGYTDGVLIEFVDDWWTVRFAEALMPKIANGIYLDADLARSRAENLEFEARGSRFFGRPGAIRFLTYLNTADMGNYEQTVADYREGVTAVPDITATRREGRHKYGFALNFEQHLTPNISVFGRLGWSDGRNESFAYTEVDRTAEAGAFSTGGAWHRANDRAGAAFVANGIVAAHQDYLRLGGLGFLLGDGGLTYGPEEIFEAFYTAHLWRGIFASADVQHINNPGYNRVRGPLLVPGLRLHVDF